jgi:galactoside O-acetyltransferase
MLAGSLKKLKAMYHIFRISGKLVKGDAVLMDSFRLIAHPRHEGKVTIGNDSMLDCTIIFESPSGEVTIGNRVFIGNSTLISRSSIVFENDIFVAWGCFFYDHDSHSLDYREREKDMTRQLEDFRGGMDFIAHKDWSVVASKPIRICSNAWIGMNCIILKGVTIGEGAVVAAGSVVTKDVPEWTVVAGNPARVVKQLAIRR